MKNNKIAWILFSVMTIVVVILSSVMIVQSVKWKTGEELLDMTPNDVESATATIHTPGPDGDFVRMIQLDKKQIEYIVCEFNRSLFERDNELYYGSVIIIEFLLKDGNKKEFSITGSINVDGKQYQCHSYLGAYCYDLFYTEE